MNLRVTAFVLSVAIVQLVGCSYSQHRSVGPRGQDWFDGCDVRVKTNSEGRFLEIDAQNIQDISSVKLFFKGTEQGYEFEVNSPSSGDPQKKYVAMKDEDESVTLKVEFPKGKCKRNSKAKVEIYEKGKGAESYEKDIICRGEGEGSLVYLEVVDKANGVVDISHNDKKVRIKMTAVDRISAGSSYSDAAKSRGSL